jgi:GntR family transcriptional regulator
MNSTHEPELILEGGAPIHRQIRDQIRTCILSGLLHPGEQLPTLRALAVGLSVNPNSIARAYARLEREGFVNTEDGSGTFVALPPPRSARVSGPHRTWPAGTRLRRLCSRLLTLAARQGYTAEEVINTLMALTHRRTSS